MRQNWERFLSLNWPVDPLLVRPLVPASLELDLFEGRAWISITPFKVTGLRVLDLPELGGLSRFDEVNVRTYVYHEGEPGIWFFSLDASKLMPVFAARVFFGLPYYSAAIDFSERDDEFEFMSQRSTLPEALLHVRWKAGGLLASPTTDTLPFFLMERYCAFSGAGDALGVTRIHHSPWTLYDAEVLASRSTLMSEAGLPEPTSRPVVYAGQQLGVEFWPIAPLT